MSFPEVTIFVFAVLQLEQGSRQAGVIFYGRISSLKRLPWWLTGKESACNVRDPGSITGLGKSPGEGNAYLLQYSCLENPMDRGA